MKLNIGSVDFLLMTSPTSKYHKDQLTFALFSLHNLHCEHFLFCALRALVKRYGGGVGQSGGNMVDKNHLMCPFRY